jgi:predicted nucleic-acid-binding Zn-ribbon protein
MSEVKKCLKCGGDMEKGYLRDAPWWRQGESLLQLGFGERIFAYRCKNCSYVEFYIEK